MTDPIEPLSAARLARQQPIEELAFETTADLPDGLVQQSRAQEALLFGTSVRGTGFNTFVLGEPGSGRHRLARRIVDERAAQGPIPSDWVYVHCFRDPEKPRALALPAGRGAKLQGAMRRLIEELQVAIPAAFEADEYRNRRQMLEHKLESRHEEALRTISELAEHNELRLLRTPMGFALAPVRNGEVVTPEQFNTWPAQDQDKTRAAMIAVEAQLGAVMSELPKWQREARLALRDLDREVAGFAAADQVREVIEAFADIPAVRAWLEEVRADVIERAHELKEEDDENQQAMLQHAFQRDSGFLSRYRANLLVDRTGCDRAPIVDEAEPRLSSLIGRIDQRVHMGALLSDFTMIRPGALHRANGGYLILDAMRVLAAPGAWDALKTSLRTKEIRIASLAESLGFVGTSILEPEPIPLDVKVVLVGERRIYYLLADLDPDFAELFKIAADFDDEVPWDAGHAMDLARTLASIARARGLLALDRGAVARMIEEASRAAGDRFKLSADVRTMSDIVCEADWLARSAAKARIEAIDIERAIELRERREGRARELTLERFGEGTVLLQTSGAVAGQINGLSVLGLGRTAFGRPSRLTCRIRLGKGEVVDIEREVDLGGPIHSKGVMILSGYLGARYALDIPLSMSASLVFEQSYGGVEGDSASLAELCALLSALADAPIAQRFAVTGSINQMGEVQPIGGVNEKIEGFFEVCRSAGLDGTHAVIIPASNERHAMLRKPVLDAIEAGRFHVYSVRTVDEAMSLLTDAPDLHARVERRLRELAAKVRAFMTDGAKP